MKRISCLLFFSIFCPTSHANPSSIASHQSPSNQWCRTESQSNFLLSLHLSSLTCLSQGSSETHLCPKHRPHYFCFCISSGKVEGAFWTLLLGCLLHEPNPNLLWCQKNSIFEQRVATQTVNNSLFKMCVLWGRARRMYFISLMTLEPNLSGVVR